MKVRTQIGYFVTRAWVTEGIRPGVLGMSHHLGRWRLDEDTGGPRVASALVRIPRERRPLRDEADARRHAVREQRSRQRPDLVERSGRPSEPDVPGAARSGQRDALLASARSPREGAARTTATATSWSTPNNAHEAYKEWMAKTRPASRARQPPASVVVRPSAASGAERLQAARSPEGIDYNVESQNWLLKKFSVNLRLGGALRGCPQGCYTRSRAYHNVASSRTTTTVMTTKGQSWRRMRSATAIRIRTAGVAISSNEAALENALIDSALRRPGRVCDDPPAPTPNDSRRRQRRLSQPRHRGLRDRSASRHTSRSCRDR